MQCPRFPRLTRVPALLYEVSAVRVEVRERTPWLKMGNFKKITFTWKVDYVIIIIYWLSLRFVLSVVFNYLEIIFYRIGYR